jgi:HAE1 family hydrophobic/amphiphilic exporter-1
MQWLAEICVRRPVFATVLTLLIVVLGITGYGSLGVDRFPKIDFPVVTVTTILPGASPADVETEITDKVEAAVNTVGSIEELRSISGEGVSLVVVQFKLERNVDLAAQDVRDRVDRILRDLPEGIEPPVVSKIDPDAAPIVYAALRAPGRSTKEITELADGSVREALEVLPGVGQVRVLGGRKRAVNVWLDPVRLRAANVAAGEVARAIGLQNLSVPGGRVDTGRDQLTLRVVGRVADALDIGQLPVRTMGDRVLRVADVATVEDGTEEAASLARWNGEQAVVLAIRKQTGANTVAVADAVRERVAEMALELPGGVSIDLIRDESGSIRTGTDGVKEHLVVGALLAAVVVLVFLGSVRSTVIAALAIPTSVLGTFAVMSWMGYTLNTITLLALALSVGIVIDDAIVVLENIFRFVEEKGMPPVQAAIEGTREIGLAVLATTFSLVAVFMPVVFLAGIPGRFLRGFGVTMSVAILVSLFVSFTLTPMLASRWLRPVVHGAPKSALERLVDTVYRPIERAYLRILAFCLRQRWIVVVAAVLSLASVPSLARVAKKGFIPVDDQAQFEVSVRAPEGMSLVATEVHAERIARQLRALPGVVGTLTTVGEGEQGNNNVGQIYIRLVDPRERKLTQDEMKELVRQDVLPKQDPTLRLSVNDVQLFGGSGASTARIQYNVTGPDLETLEKIAANAVAELKKVPGAVDVDSSLVVGKPEVAVHVDRVRAAQLGVSVGDIANTLQLLVAGKKVSTYEEDGDQYEVRVRAERQWRGDPSILGLLPVPTANGGHVALADLVDFQTDTGPASINRLARQRVVTLLANAAPGTGENVIGDALVKILDGMNLSDAYSVKPTGQTKLMKETGQSVLLGFGLAFVFMYLVLAAQFESWVHPFTILLSLPLTLPFAILSIVLTGQALDMFSVLGIFVLFGIVKKNSILQIDHTNHLREQGLDRTAAILQANRDRLRPILMTTLAFVAGMIPLALSKGVGSGFNRATSGVVVGGQTLSLLLTLLATPVAYTFFDDFLEGTRRVLRRIGLISTGGNT